MSRPCRPGRMTVQHMALCALFAALTAVCAQIILPIGAVPVSLSLLPVLVCAALLSWTDSLLAMGVYLLLGLFGAPVFSGFAGGPAKLFGVTGGYLLGYLPCVLVIGLLRRRSFRRYAAQAAVLALGVLACYAFGTAWFMMLRGTGLWESLSVCVIPFLPFDAVKILLAVHLSRRLDPLCARVLQGGNAA